MDIQQQEDLENIKSQIDKALQDLDKKYYCYLTFNTHIYKNTKQIIRTYDANIFQGKLDIFIQSNIEEDKLRFKTLLKALNDLDYQFHLSQMNK